MKLVSYHTNDGRIGRFLCEAGQVKDYLSNLRGGSVIAEIDYTPMTLKKRPKGEQTKVKRMLPIEGSETQRRKAGRNKTAKKWSRKLADRVKAWQSCQGKGKHQHRQPGSLKHY